MKRTLQVTTLLITFALLCSGILVIGFEQEDTDDFYFIHITDTHILNYIFDRQQIRTNKLIDLIERINSFDNKPVFIVITGDLVEFGSGALGALNYMTLIECFHKNEGQYYIDENYSIPIYFTPGNHDYYYQWNLINYHRFIDGKHILNNNRYVVTVGNLSLFFLNSGFHYIPRPLRVLGSGLTRYDIDWLDESLNECTSTHKVVLMHHPAINWGNFDVIARHKNTFVDMCRGYNVDLVLTGHTHASRVFDNEGTFYPNELLPLNCSQYSTLHVQTDACNEGGYYRNISIVHNDIWLHNSYI